MTAIPLLKAAFMPHKPTITLEQKVELTDALNELTEYDHHFSLEKTSHALRPKASGVGELSLVLDEKGWVVSTKKLTDAALVEPLDLHDGVTTYPFADNLESVKANHKTVFVTSMKPLADAPLFTVITRDNVTSLGYNVDIIPETQALLGEIFSKIVDTFVDIDFSKLQLLHVVNPATYMGAEIHHLHFDIPTNNSGSLLTVTFLHKRYITP